MAALPFEAGTHHCAIFHGDDHGATHRNFRECKLHPGHEQFMTVDDFLKKTPREIGLTDSLMPKVKNDIDRTVRVIGTYISTGRPETFMNSSSPYPCVDKRGFHHLIRYGTGYLVDRHGFDVKDHGCPCPECKESPTYESQNRESFYFVIKTATHVIFDEREAQNSVFEFFYDTENRDAVKKMYGVTVLDSKHRLETDKSLVVCVTHDGSLADKLSNLIRPPSELLPSGVLVSHPHGISKRVSVGDRPQFTIVLILDETTHASLTLKKGMRIRLPSVPDAAYLVQDINGVLDKRVIDLDVSSQAYALCCDLAVHRPGGVVVKTDFYDNVGCFTFKRNNQSWINMFSPGTHLETDEGKRYTFPYKDNKTPVIQMEAFGKLIDFTSGSKPRSFSFTRYKMASCPGSSGAHIVSLRGHPFIRETGLVHFGNSGDFNTSSLICIHEPEY